MTETSLPPSRLRWVCPLDALDFETTSELDPIDDVFGQPRATEALRFGLNFRAPGQHVFMRGGEGTGRSTLVRRLLDEPGELPDRARDRVVVMDFETPDRPALLSLRLGEAPAFVEATRDLGNFLTHDLLLEVEVTVVLAKRELDLAAQTALAERADPFEAGLAEAGLALARITDEDGESETRVLPVVDGEPISIGDLEAAAARGEMDPEDVANIVAAATRFTGHLAEVTRHAKTVQREHDKKVETLFREAASAAIDVFLKPLIDKFPSALRFFEQVRDFATRHLDELSESPQAVTRLLEVNVLLTRPKGSTRPVVFEHAPSVQTLLGTIDLPSIEGTAPHLGVRAGSLLRADGGTLILDARALLRREGAWEALSRCLRTGLVELLSDEAPTTLRPPGIKPEPIPIDVKVVMLGDEAVYAVLDQGDPEFPDLFKVLVDFDRTLPAAPDSIKAYAQVIAGVVRRDGLPPFQRGAVAALVEHGARIASLNGQLTARFGRIADIAREAAFLANGAPIVRDHVLQAVSRIRARGAGPGRRFRDRIANGGIRILTRGTAVGELNGLAVIQAGSLAYGMPTRITATAGPGSGGAINVEHEALLSGNIHIKSFHILSGLLRRLMKSNHPLVYEASIAFEQSYFGIDGDSASGASFCVLLSALTGLPVRQDLAMTGAIDQVGNVLPIGAVNEKIEGFFDTCVRMGLTGTQGVVIPTANADDLMLRHDVVERAKNDGFHVYAVSDIREAIALFFGRSAEDVLDAARKALQQHWKSSKKSLL